MGIAERIYEAVKSLPESMASEVLDYVEGKRARSAANDATVRRTAALALLDSVGANAMQETEQKGSRARWPKNLREFGIGTVLPVARIRTSW